jgi:hypothetical protein
MYNIDMISDNKPDPQSPTPIRQTLEQARDLARSGRYLDAKAVLETIADHPTAQKRLIQINGTILDAELAFDFPDALPQPLDIPPEKIEYRFWTHFRTLYASFAQNGLVNLIFGGVLIVLGMLMIVNFIALSWIDSRDAALWTPNLEGVSKTGLQIWFGSETGTFDTLDLEKDSLGESGLRAVRTVDRLLIIIPFASIYLILLSLRLLLIPNHTRRSLYVLAAIAFVLFAMPYVWETLSTRQWQGYLESVPPERLFGPYGEGLRLTFGNQALSALAGEFLALLLYDTDEQKILGAMAFIACLVMVGGRLASREGEVEHADINPKNDMENGAIG